MHQIQRLGWVCSPDLWPSMEPWEGYPRIMHVWWFSSYYISVWQVGNIFGQTSVWKGKAIVWRARSEVLYAYHKATKCMGWCISLGGTQADSKCHALVIRIERFTGFIHLFAGVPGNMQKHEQNKLMMKAIAYTLLGDILYKMGKDMVLSRVIWKSEERVMEASFREAYRPEASAPGKCFTGGSEVSSFLPKLQPPPCRRFHWER